MKRILLLVSVIVCSSLFAEYQVFAFKASVRLPEPQYATIEKAPQLASRTRTVSVKGYLVTVCCYPCGADFGKGYPSRLYLVRSNDETKTVHRIPAKVTGGVYGIGCPTEGIMDAYLEWEDRSRWIKLAKKATQCWVEVYTESSMYGDVWKKHKGGYAKFANGLFGVGTEISKMTFAGTGSASNKIDQRYDPQFQTYVRSVSGSCTGIATMASSSFDPSNYGSYGRCAMAGTFIMLFNSKLTKEIKGIADWNRIDTIILSHIKYYESLREPDIEEWQYDE